MTKMTLEDVNARLEEATLRKQRYAEREKILRRRAAELTVKNRTHRLCTRGAMLETFLEEPESLTDDQVMTLLKLAFNKPDVQKTLHDWLDAIPKVEEETETE